MERNPVRAEQPHMPTAIETMVYFSVRIVTVRYVLRYLICALWMGGAIPAALAMLKDKDLAHAALKG